MIPVDPCLGWQPMQPGQKEVLSALSIACAKMQEPRSGRFFKRLQKRTKHRKEKHRMLRLF